MKDRAPPPGLRAGRFEHRGEALVVFSYPTAPVSVFASTSSAAQAEVADLVLEGRSNREIARLRGTAPATVAKQLEDIYRRLGINSRRELAVAAARLGQPPRPGE